MAARSRTTSMEQQAPTQKRQRAGSISGRLRAASDLEEHGLIDKQQKGIFKDLIISGDAAMQSALDRYEQQGDASEIKELIAGSSGRRQSIDLLDGLDLDFLHVKKNFGGSFDGDLFFDDLGADSNDPFKLFSTDDAPTAQRTTGIAAQPSRIRTTSGQYCATMEGGDQVDMSEYDAIAASLQNFQPQHGDPMAYYMNTRDRMNSGSFSMDPAPGRERMGSFALDAGGRDRMGSFVMDAGGRDRLNSTSSLYDGARGRFDSATSISSFGQVHPGAAPQQQVGMRRELGLQHPQPSDVGPIASAFGMNQQQQKVPFAEYFTEQPHYADGEIHGDIEGREKYVGVYSPEARRKRIERFLEKRKRRVWTKKVKYDVRKNFADSRLRVKGRFVKKEDEETLRELLTI